MRNISIPAKVYTAVDARIDDFLTNGSCKRLDQPDNWLRQPDDNIYYDTASQSSKLAGCSRLVKKLHHLPPILHCSPWPSYNRGLDRILMPHKQRFSTPELYYSTLFHEAVHGTGHSSRLSRPEHLGWKNPDDANYCREELIAEHGAAYLCAHSRIEPETFAYSACYIQNYLALLPPDPSALTAIRTQAREAVTYLLPPPQ